MEPTLEPQKKRVLGKAKKLYPVIGAILALALIGGTVAAILLLTQTVPVVQSQAILSTTCVDAGHPLTANSTTYIAGGTAYIRFTCTADGQGYTAKNSIISTPTFTLPAPFTQLWSFRQSTAVGTTCAAGTGAWQMTSTSPHTFPSGSTTWDYCALIPNTATVDSTTFTVAWSA